MPDEMDKPPAVEAVATEQLSNVERLIKETGITKAQARDLIGVLGADWGSLVREARFLAKRKS